MLTVSGVFSSQKVVDEIVEALGDAGLGKDRITVSPAGDSGEMAVSVDVSDEVADATIAIFHHGHGKAIEAAGDASRKHNPGVR